MNRSQKIYFSLFVCIAVLLAVIGSRAQVVRSVGTTNELVNLPNPNSISSNTLVTSSAEFWSWVVGDATAPNGSNVLQSATDPTGGRFKLLPISSIITSIGGFRVTNLFVTIITNVDAIYVTNIYATNIEVNVLTNVGYFYVTNIYSSNIYATNIYVNLLTNVGYFYVTNIYATNIYATNIYVNIISNVNKLTVTNLYANYITINNTNVPTINPTDTYIPYRASTNAFEDSPLYVSGSDVRTAGNIGAVLAVGSTTAVDMTYGSATNQVAGALTFLHATNGVDLVDKTHVRWLFNSSGSDQTLTIPSGWRTNANSAVPTKVTNGWITVMYVKCNGPTDTAARQTNAYVSFEYYH